MSYDDSLLEQLPPEKLLDTSNTRVITPAIAMMESVETVEQYLEHERANRNRAGIIRHLTERLDTIYEATGDHPSEPEAEPKLEPKPEQEPTPISRQSPPLKNETPATPPTTERPAATQQPVPESAGVWMPTEDLLCLVDDLGPNGLGGPSTPPLWDEL